MLNRPRQVQKLYDVLSGRDYVHVHEIYQRTRGKPHAGSPKECQQGIGSLITRFNRWHEGTGVRAQTGAEPYTYRLVIES